MSSFADRLQHSIETSHSYLVAGLDPGMKDVPSFVVEHAQAHSQNNADMIYAVLMGMYREALPSLQGLVAAVKPNIAFFEQFGLAGLRAFADVLKLAKDLQLPVIADAKRGDIGSTAAAYSSAFLGRSDIFGKKEAIFDADALTVNPFLGFDTVEVFLKDCLEYEKGLFVLVKTSNPGSSQTQGTISASGSAAAVPSLSERIAGWLAEKADLLQGSCGFSGLGAVIGATYPEEARHLRNLMPSNFFLIPGMGAQGGTAQDALAGFGRHPHTGRLGAAVINVSRGLFSGMPSAASNSAGYREELQRRAQEFNAQISKAMA